MRGRLRRWLHGGGGFPAWALAGLVGCGGGGGGDITGAPDGGNTPPPGNVAITAANQDAIARATVQVALGGRPFDPAVLVTGNLSGAVAACAGGGTRVAVLDDRDVSTGLSAGDVLEVNFNACRETSLAAAQLDGTLRLTFMQFSAAPSLSMQVLVTMSPLTRTLLSAPSRSVRYDGTAEITYLEPTPGNYSSELRIGASHALTLAVAHPLYADTVTLRPGYVGTQRGSPPGPTGPVSWREWAEINGAFASAAAGGWVTAYGAPPLFRYVDLDVYPTDGYIQANGELGSLQLTVQPGQQVLQALDTHTGTTASRLVAWADLI